MRSRLHLVPLCADISEIAKAIPAWYVSFMSDKKFWLGFNLVKGIGPAKMQALLDAFEGVEAAWMASEPQLKKLGFDQRAITNLLEARSTLNLQATWSW